MKLGTLKLKKHNQKNLPEFKVDDINSFPMGGAVTKRFISDQNFPDMIVFKNSSNVTLNTTFINHVEPLLNFTVFASIEPGLNLSKVQEYHKNNSVHLNAPRNTINDYSFSLSNVVDAAGNVTTVSNVNNMYIYAYSEFDYNNSTFASFHVVSNNAAQVTFTSIQQDSLGNVDVSVHVSNTNGTSNMKVGVVVIQETDSVDAYVSSIQTDALGYTNVFEPFTFGSFSGTFNTFYTTGDLIGLGSYKVVAYVLYDNTVHSYVARNQNGHTSSAIFG